jgi:hypothetical protein
MISFGFLDLEGGKNVKGVVLDEVQYPFSLPFPPYDV